MLLIRMHSPFNQHDGGTVHILDGAASVTQWRSLCGRRKSKRHAGPFEQADLNAIAVRHIPVNCSRCRRIAEHDRVPAP